MWYDVDGDVKKKKTKTKKEKKQVDTSSSILSIKAMARLQCHTKKCMIWNYYSITYHNKCSRNLFSSIPGIKFNKQCSRARNMHSTL